jgi:hypothetical protein
MGGKSRKSGGGVSKQLITQLKYGNYQVNDTAVKGDTRKKKGGTNVTTDKKSTGGFGLLDE